MTTKPNMDSRKQVQDGQDWYEVEVAGQIHPGWFDFLEGWAITPLSDGNTRLCGPVVDQPALHGLFARIRDLNLKIISLQIRNHSPPGGNRRYFPLFRGSGIQICGYRLKFSFL